MTPEEFERIKEAEKEHLRSLKKLKQAVQDLERQKKLTSAVDDIKSSEDLMNEHDHLVDKLAMETAHNEARLEVALESAAEQESARRAEEARARLDADLQKIRARDLVKQLKNQIEGGPENHKPTAAAPEAETQEVVERPSTPEADPPSSEEPLPEKTIGRMRKK